VASRRVPARSARRRDPEEKRARILDAGSALFAERGYAATTTADVARRAGVSEGILFHHFGSKRELLHAVASEYGSGLARAMFDAAPARGEAPSADAMLRAAFRYVRERGAVGRLLGLSSDPSDGFAARNASRGEIVAALERGLAEWSARGLVRPVEPRLAAELLFALVEAALQACFVREDGSREEDWLRETVRCVEGAVSLAPSTAQAPIDCAPIQPAPRSEP
jgi:AcrR family transcriptional regulator